jgi:glucose/arabinose dehydrogenase
LLAAVSLPAAATAAALRPGFSETVIASGLADPSAMAVAPDGRIFVALQGGAVRVIKNGELLPAPFVTVAVNAAGERGLIGIALDPLFTVNGFVYLHYTATTPTIHNRVSRFTASGDVAVPGSEVMLLDLPTLNATNHNGGAIHFGPDGFLYIGVGENAVGANAQSLSSPLGKILRIGKDGSIPANNPFFGSTTGTSRAIWAYGLRNPFTFAFDPDTGRMVINDVGQAAWEEINEGAAGANYGWPATEGPTTDPRFTPPIYAYTHAATGGCAITGAAFYPLLPSQFPDEYAGDYFFADLCAGWIGHYDFATDTASLDFATAVGMPVDLALAPEGGLYYLERSDGRLARIDFSRQAPPVILDRPVSQTVSAGQPVTFAVSATGTPPVTYQWFRNDVAIPGATGTSYTLPSVSVADTGARFTVRVSNAHGDVMSSGATLTVVSVSVRPRSRSAGAVSTGRTARPRR